MSDQHQGLLSHTVIRIFGHRYTGLSIGDLGIPPTSNDPLSTRLRSAGPGDCGLALIYGYTYHGKFVTLRQPTIMLVWGPGVTLGDGDTAVASSLGVAFKGRAFALGITMWTANRADIGICVDVSHGFVKDLLRDAEGKDSATEKRARYCSP
jgi:hypothetical protein